MAMNAFQHYVGRHNRAKVALLEQNHSISEFFDGVLDHLVSFCATEGIAMEDIDIKDTFIGHDKHLNATISWKRRDGVAQMPR